MQIQPYLFFNGRCDEAIAFYAKALGAKVETLQRFNESPEPMPNFLPPNWDEKIMHASIRIGETTVFVSDGNEQTKAAFQGFSLSLGVASAADADRLFNALADGGQVLMPIGQTFFSPRFGMVADRFGVSWTIIAAPAA